MTSNIRYLASLNTLEPTEADLRKEYYADTANLRFQEREDDYVTVGELMADELSRTAKELESVKEDFRKTHVYIKNCKDLNISTVKHTTLDKLMVDRNRQRRLQAHWVLEILSRFKSSKVRTLNVYTDPHFPGCYMVWDGQHTLVVLASVADAMGIPYSEFQVPIEVMNINNIAETRENFMGACNGDDAESMSRVEMHRQMVLGVRVDNSSNESWKRNESLQCILEKYKMFVTDEKEEKLKPGAIGNTAELLQPALSLTLLEQWCKYRWAISKNKNAMAPAEFWLISSYITLCRDQGIKITDEYILAFANSLFIAFNGKFDVNKFVKKAKASYDQWWLEQPENREQGYTKDNLKKYAFGHEGDNHKKVALNFLIPQIGKYMDSKYKLPKYNFDGWKVSSSQLFANLEA